MAQVQINFNYPQTAKMSGRRHQRRCTTRPVRISLIDDRWCHRKRCYRRRQKLAIKGIGRIGFIENLNLQAAVHLPNVIGAVMKEQATPDKQIVEVENLSTRSSSCALESYDQMRESVLVWMQATASDEFLSRHTYSLAAEYLDLYYSHPQTSQEVSDTDDLQALAAACLSVAVKLDECYRLRLDRLSIISTVEKPFIIAKEIQLAVRLQYFLRRNSYSRVLDELLDAWDRSPLNSLRQNFFSNEESSYQRYRNIYHLIDRMNITARLSDFHTAAYTCMFKILGDSANLRQFTGWTPPLTITMEPLQHFQRHPNSEHNFGYTQYLRLQTFIE